MHLIDANHKLVMHHIHRIKELSVMLALKTLKSYITQRLALNEERRRTDEAVVTYIWIATSSPDGSPTLQANALKNDIGDIHTAWKQALCPDAAHAILLLLWKQIERTRDDRRDAETAKWCELGLHALLSDAGEINIGKVQRKLISYHLSIPDYDRAKQVAESMTDGVRQQPLSLCLSYTVSLRCRDESSSEAALSRIAKIRDKDSQLLLACIGETMKNGSKRQGVRLLQRVLDKFNYELPEDIDTCAMLRCTARLILSTLEQEEADDEMLSRLCSIFRAAQGCIAARHDSRDSKTTAKLAQESGWFQRNAYNLALEHVNVWPNKVVIDLISYSDQMETFATRPAEDQLQAIRHRASTAYSQCVLYIIEARRCNDKWTIEDIPRTSYSSRKRPSPNQLQRHLYQNAFANFSKLKQLLESDDVRCESELYEELRQKVALLLSIGFEALLFMTLADTPPDGRFDHIGLATLIDTASKTQAQPKVYALFADMILSSITNAETAADSGHIPLPSAITLLQKIIRAIRKQDDYDVGKAARWIRCIVQIILDHPAEQKEREMQLVEKMADEALNLARSSVQQEDDAMDLDEGDSQRQVYPADELEWLSTVLFNLTVDYYIKEDRDRCEKWVERSVGLADVLGNMRKRNGGDGGMLSRCLRGKAGMMGFKM